MSATRPSSSRAAEAEPLVPEKVLRFMNSLPTTGDTVEWILRFRAALQELLGDVDRVAVRINVVCDLLAPEQYHPTVDLSLHPRPESKDVMITSNSIKQSPSERMIAEFARLGRPLEEYQSPLCYDYYLGDHAHLATILLFRMRGRPPVSARTRRTMAALEPFLLFAFSGHVTRRHMAKGVDHHFTAMLSKVQCDAGLSERERQVMTLHLLGMSYRQIAERLFISEHTVAKHVKSAHQKTGCASFLELFAPYFREAHEEVADGER